jgi:hypothetical protein
VLRPLARKGGNERFLGLRGSGVKPSLAMIGDVWMVVIEQPSQLTDRIGMHVDPQVQFGDFARAVDKQGGRAFR